MEDQRKTHVALLMLARNIVATDTENQLQRLQKATKQQKSSADGLPRVIDVQPMRLLTAERAALRASRQASTGSTAGAHISSGPVPRATVSRGPSAPTRVQSAPKSAAVVVPKRSSSLKALPKPVNPATELRAASVPPLSDQPRVSDLKVEPAQAEPAQIKPAQIKPAQIEPAQFEPAQASNSMNDLTTTLPSVNLALHQSPVTASTPQINPATRARIVQDEACVAIPSPLQRETPVTPRIRELRPQETASPLRKLDSNASPSRLVPKQAISKAKKPLELPTIDGATKAVTNPKWFTQSSTTATGATTAGRTQNLAPGTPRPAPSVFDRLQRPTVASAARSLASKHPGSPLTRPAKSIRPSHVGSKLASSMGPGKLRPPPSLLPIHAKATPKPIAQIKQTAGYNTMKAPGTSVAKGGTIPSTIPSTASVLRNNNVAAKTVKPPGNQPKATSSQTAVPMAAPKTTPMPVDAPKTPMPKTPAKAGVDAVSTPARGTNIIRLAVTPKILAKLGPPASPKPAQQTVPRTPIGCAEFLPDISTPCLPDISRGSNDTVFHDWAEYDNVRPVVEKQNNKEIRRMFGKMPEIHMDVIFAEARRNHKRQVGAGY